MGALIAELELARKDGVEKRSVRLALTDEGIGLDAQDLGPTVERFWGDIDYEFGIRIAAADLPRLAYALIVRHYRDRIDAVGEVRQLADDAGIDAHFWSWA